jgi:hypothetical protein
MAPRSGRLQQSLDIALDVGDADQVLEFFAQAAEADLTRQTCMLVAFCAARMETGDDWARFVCGLAQGVGNIVAQKVPVDRREQALAALHIGLDAVVPSTTAAVEQAVDRSNGNAPGDIAAATDEPDDDLPLDLERLTEEVATTPPGRATSTVRDPDPASTMAALAQYVENVTVGLASTVTSTLHPGDVEFGIEQVCRQISDNLRSHVVAVQTLEAMAEKRRRGASLDA